VPEWITAVPGDCCGAADYKQQSTHHEGTEVHVYAECLSCGAAWRDVFTFGRAERRAD
jgi:hypothetical protein